MLRCFVVFLRLAAEWADGRCALVPAEAVVSLERIRSTGGEGDRDILRNKTKSRDPASRSYEAASTKLFRWVEAQMRRRYLWLTCAFCWRRSRSCLSHAPVSRRCPSSASSARSLRSRTSRTRRLTGWRRHSRPGPWNACRNRRRRAHPKGQPMWQRRSLRQKQIITI